MRPGLACNNASRLQQLQVISPGGGLSLRIAWPVVTTTVFSFRRRFFPKKMKLNDVTYDQVFDAVDNLNSRPRKCLKYQTPYEVFLALTGIDVKNILGCALMT